MEALEALRIAATVLAAAVALESAPPARPPASAAA